MTGHHADLASRLRVAAARLAEHGLDWPNASISTVVDMAQGAMFDDTRLCDLIAQADRLQACCHLLYHVEWLLDNLLKVPAISPESNELRQWLLPRLEALCKSISPESYMDALRRYRAYVKLAASLLTLDSWQSPSSHNPFYHVYHRQCVPLRQSIADKFLAMEPPIYSHWAAPLLFSSYMAGFDTLLWAFREQEMAINWLVDDKAYFECRRLLEALPSTSNIHYVNVHDQRTFVDALLRVRPQVILLDVAPNWYDMPILDLRMIFDSLGQCTPSGPRYIVFDHSLVGPLFDLSDYVGVHPHFDDVFVCARSLQKLDVCCLDLCSGGYFKVLTHKHRDDLLSFPDRLNVLASLLGTGLSEHSAFLLHPPRPELHRSWRALSFRNGWWLCKELREHLLPCAPVKTVHHPGMPDHPAHKRLGRDGSLVPPIVFIEIGQTPSDFFTTNDVASEDLDCCSSDAANEILIGASFGFHQTRVGWWANEDKLALRVAVGLEPMDELPRVLRQVVDFIIKFDCTNNSRVSEIPI